MAKYHINDNGEPGKCRAFSGNCPFGGSDAHYDSENAAYDAISKQAGGSFNRPENVQIKRKDRLEIATNSSDPAELLAVAKGLGEFSPSRKAAAALAKNPASTADVLVEARSKASLAYNEFVDLEQHPNYPLNRMSGEGAHRRVKTVSKEEIAALFEREDVGDNLVDQASFDYPDLLPIALRNPNNKLSDRTRARFALTNFDTVRAAAESGVWPARNDISGRNKYSTGETYSTGNGWATREGSIPSDTLVNVASYTPNEQIAKDLVQKLGNTVNGPALYRNLALNPRLTPEFKKQFISELESAAKTIQETINSIK